MYLGHWGKSRNLRPNTQIHGCVIHSVKVHISHQMKPCSSVKVICLVKLYLFLCICGIGTSQLNQAQITQIMDSNTPKVIRSVKLNISHQMMPYSSLKTICGSIYTCFVYLQNWGKLAKFSPITSNHGQRYTESHSKC